MSTALGGDSFVLATLLHFMAIDHDVRVEAPVSGRLLRGVEELQAYWSLWKPDRYRRISIVPDEVVPGYPMDSGQGIAAFSGGGVDSTYTVLRHVRGLARSDRVDLGAVMVVHGFDIHHARRDVYDAALERIDAQLSDLEVERLSVWTDFRELGQDWEDSHGLGVAACLTLFQDCFTVGLIGGTFPYNYGKVMPWGSSPQTDHLFSTGSMDIRHDGAAASRMEKISTIAKWPTQARHLRVCYDGLTASSNCGRCYKCVTTYLNFRALGENPPDFDHFPTSSDIRSLEAPSMRHLRTLRGISAHAHVTSNTGPEFGHFLSA